MPVPGFLIGELSSGKWRSMCCLAKWMPSLSRVWMMKVCTGQKVSSGKESVPSPSWLLTITSS